MDYQTWYNLIIKYLHFGFINVNYRQQPSPLLFSIDILARPQLQANTAWNESLHNTLRKRVSLALPCWKLARTIIYRPFCTASAICCMLSMIVTTKAPSKTYALVKYLNCLQLKQHDNNNENSDFSAKTTTVHRLNTTLEIAHIPLVK